MNANDLRRTGNISMGLAMVAAVVAALSLMSVTSTAYGASDDRGSDDRSSDDRSSDDRGSDDHGGDDHGGDRDDNGGHSSSDDVGYDDHGRRHGGHGADDMAQGGVMLPVLGDVVADWESRGYRVLEIDREDGSVVEMDVISPEGQRIEMYVDVGTNTILSQHLED